MIRVQGHCPQGCGNTLFLGEGGFVTCSYLHCPEPDCVASLLDERETEHIVTFDDDGFSILHPLREHLRDQLERCDLHAFCLSLSGPPVKPGRYRSFPDSPVWAFVPLDEQGAA